MRFGYPVFLDLHDVPVLVVGAGPVAARKVAGLAEAGASIRVVARDVSSDLDLDHVAELRRRPYEPGDLDGIRLVVTATGDPGVDADVAADATAAGIWVNAADQPADCTFILPAVARNGPLAIAVSTDGASPALARRLRDRSAELITDQVVDVAGELAARRAAVRAAGGSTEDVDWSGLIDPVVPPTG
jgi:siroheme synthase-like protein